MHYDYYQISGPQNIVFGSIVCARPQKIDTVVGWKTDPSQESDECASPLLGYVDVFILRLYHTGTQLSISVPNVTKTLKH